MSTRTPIAINDAPWNSSQVLTWTSGTSPFSLINDEQTELLVYMAPPSGNTCFIRGVDDELGRSTDIRLDPPSSGSPIIYRVGPFPSDGYNQATDNYLIHVDLAGEGGGMVKICAIRAQR